MAFYTSRVDDNGNEIERRHSARSLATPPPLLTENGSTTRLNLSSRSCETKASVRYVNPAAYIEKTPENSDTSSLGTAMSCENQKYQSTVSESQSDLISFTISVPPLDLQSEDNYPTTRDYTFSYRKHCEAAKIVLKPDQAYETWLSAKRKLISDEAARRKKAEELKRKEQEERKRVSEEKYQKWLETKSRQPTRSREKFKSNNGGAEDKEERSPPKSQLSEEEAQAKLEEWERAKRLEEERRRMLQRQEEERRLEMEEQRRQMAAEAWEKWLADAAKKPKPVPLNRGIFTLRGTISDIFVNPNEWQSTGPIKED